jgi:hypothetical protein
MRESNGRDDRMGRRLRIGTAAVCWVAAFAWSESEAAEIAAGLRDFLATYRCAVVVRLERMHARGDRSTQTERFIILESRRARQHYVQCIFTENDTEMFCEAASGFYAPEASRFQLTPQELVALKRLGFTTDGSMGNFHRVIGTKSPADFAKVADLMLSTLYEVYGVRGSGLGWGLVPLTPELEGIPTHCVPIG